MNRKRKQFCAPSSVSSPRCSRSRPQNLTFNWAYLQLGERVFAQLQLVSQGHVLLCPLLAVVSACLRVGVRQGVFELPFELLVAVLRRQGGFELFWLFFLVFLLALLPGFGSKQMPKKKCHVGPLGKKFFFFSTRPRTLLARKLHLPVNFIRP